MGVLMEFLAFFVFICRLRSQVQQLFICFLSLFRFLVVSFIFIVAKIINVGWKHAQCSDVCCGRKGEGLCQGGCQCTDKKMHQMVPVMTGLHSGRRFGFFFTLLPPCDNTSSFGECSLHDQREKKIVYCIAGNFCKEFNFVAFVKAMFWLN